MAAKDVSDAELDAFRRFVKLFPHDADLTLAVLRGHLLIEEQVRNIMRERVADTEALEQARLTSAQALHIARALIGGSKRDRFWEGAEKLNSLRNDLAHNIEPRKVQESVREIIRISGTKDFNQEEKVQFEFALWGLFVDVIALVQRPNATVLELVKRE